MTADSKHSSSSKPESVGTRAVIRLLDRHDVPERKRNQVIEQVLGVNYQTARRRLADEVEWTLEDITAVAEHFGETLAMVFADAPSSAVAATFVAGAVRIPCLVWMGGKSQPGRGLPLVALRAAGSQDWEVVPLLEAKHTPSREILRVVLDSRQPRPRIAVLDDDRDVADSIASYCQVVGYEGQPFYKLSDLAKRLREERFDGYVLDWVVGQTSAAELVAEIRAQDASCPIVVLTGQIGTGAVRESELMAASTRHGFQWIEKPARSAAITSALMQAFVRQTNV